MTRTSTDRAAQWLYRGVWRVLTDWFRVPAEPPTLPVRPGERLERFKPAEGFLGYLKLWFWIGLVIVDVVLTVLWLATFAIDVWVGIVLFPAYLVVAVLPDVIAYVAIHLRYDTTWYVLSDRSLRIRRGIWVIRETTITFENVQDVKIRQGPVERWFGISDVLVSTAGGGGGGGGKGSEHGGTSDAHVGRVEGIADPTRIRELIMTRVRGSRSAGLGDEEGDDRAGAATHRAPRSTWSPRHVAVLREIRDAAAGLGTPDRLGGAR